MPRNSAAGYFTPKYVPISLALLTTQYLNPAQWNFEDFDPTDLLPLVLRHPEPCPELDSGSIDFSISFLG
jgi:hypothetical protein